MAYGQSTPALRVPASPPVSADVYTDFRGLERLRSKARDDDPEALRAAASQFEALFVKMMLKSMRATTVGDPMLASDGEDMYRDLLDHQLSLEVSAGHGMGIADMLVRQLGGAFQDGSAPVAAGGLRRQKETDPTAAPAPAAPDAAAGNPPPTPALAALDSPAAFVRSLWPHAQRAGDALGVSPRLLLAQAALETGWGQSIIKRPDGTSTHNLFGIKAGRDWAGDRAVVSTVEYSDGVMVHTRAPFRAYGSFAESFEDYVAFVTGQSRYESAVAKAGDPEAYIRALHGAGYATDPAYPDKILDIMRRDTIPFKIAVAAPIAE